MSARYSKHHGLGNDFLIVLTDSLPLDAVDRAISLCDRHTGIGADGLIFGITRPDGRIVMRLLNSDGSPAALSGNGLRCFAHAVALERGVPHLELDVDTPAGVRHCSVMATDEQNTVRATVDMGVVCPGPDPDV
jgi:diaminopimelate epimerase